MHPFALAGFAIALIGAAAGLSTVAIAATPRLSDLPAGKAYGTCLRIARQHPDDGFEAAITWRDEGGGPAAKHCAAMALVNLGQFADAALRLENLVDDMKDFTAAQRAAVLGQSGRAWNRAGQPERARAVLSEAIKLAPDNAELYVDRGEILADSHHLWEAIDDFNAALDRAPDNLYALIFRGAAYRLLDTPELARVDLEAALKHDKDNPDALVELGAVDLEDGKRDAARQRWLRAINVAPKSRAADAARRWLEKIDVKVGKNKK